jgi:Spy/CpxP family protein refolding chaperone
MFRTRTALMIALIMTGWSYCPQGTAYAQDASPRVTREPVDGNYQTITDEDIQMLRKDIRSQRKQLIAANMKLTDTEAEKFWPVYEQYISELVKSNSKKYALIKQYIQSGGALSDADAESAVKQWVDVDASVAQLRMQYIPNFRKVLSPKSMALFYQLDRRVQLMIDLQLASTIPLIQP